jgi:UDP-N-acetylmuramyl pentapeptide phosphotransferase/UDP-N-acetylglucosamine-1-phosphate transferase
MIAIQPYYLYLLAVIGSLAISLFSIPNIIYIAKKKRLFDMPDNHRKLHTRIVPNLGGVGIFFAFFITASLFSLRFTSWNYIATACLILFITGLKDDLVNISPSKKFIAQAFAATITVTLGDVRLDSLGGLFGIHQLPDWASIPFSIVGCIFVTNAFNLIDGIDGLAGTIGVYICVMLGLCLAAFGNTNAAILAFSLSGALIGFLKSNLPPARIFMGDTGSLLIGFVVSVLGIMTINGFLAGGSIAGIVVSDPSPGIFVITLAILFLPVFDTFRVFTMRILRGHSPFRADRTHLHHYLLDIGLSHGQTVSVILLANILLTSLSLFVQHYNINIAIASLLIFMLGMYSILVYMRRSHLQLGDVSRPLLSRKSKSKSVVINDGITVPGTVVVNGKPIHLEEPMRREEALVLSDATSN